MTSAATRRTRTRLLLAAASTLFAATALAAEADPRRAPADAPPIWTPVPTRIDRARETRERLAPPTAALPATVPGTRVTGARAADAVTLLIDGRRHRLFGLAPADPGRICTTPAGARWACGLRAHATLSALVTGRTLRCLGVGDAADTDPVVDCRTHDRSLSERLVAEGWADLDDAGRATPALAAARAEAERRGRGVWSKTGAP